MLIEFPDQLAVITGGAGGVGYVCAKTLLQSGASVAILDVKKEALDQAVEELSAFYSASKGAVVALRKS